MPLELPAPIIQPAKTIGAQTIAAFICDPIRMSISVRMMYLDDSGAPVPGMDFDFTSSLIKDGAPRFTPEFYAELKGLIYRLGIEDGFLSGTVV